MKWDTSNVALSWFHEQYKLGHLILKPPFQRKPVWQLRQKCYLIESILEGLPVPEIYVQRTTSAEGDTEYAIVDGQQRMRSVLEFIGSATDQLDHDDNKFTLDVLDETSKWHDLAFADLDVQQRQEFFGYRFAVRYLDTSSDIDVRNMFKRLNKYLTPLNAQELRNATYAGPLIRICEDLAEEEFWTENRVITPAQIRRMKDIEFMSELLFGVLHGPQGGSAKIIDEYYSQYEDYEDEFPGQAEALKRFHKALQIITSMFEEDIKDYRWSNKTDFYSLFVCIADQLKRRRVLSRQKVDEAKDALITFAEHVAERLADEEYEASDEVIQYVRAVEKGANDKARRVARHEALKSVLHEYFSKVKYIKRPIGAKKKGR